ncbi:hypothetical protein E7T06_02700 [Deinococcus sp. Arct2-2]|uniref:hypothetical protein n=1 Tax=Deinococcus sp. Arct2-2 TaxID=2568653 RepID=UPI0010A3C9D7|nr:hypothetical protein [Deinococcus sp. Arct2-2]THF71543.1 hypothetical protein E7T06_02700 [Deinococcus sp. Arct2-2]
MKRPVLALALLAGVALAATTNLSVIVNGQVAPDAAIVVNGKTYVPLSALNLLGVKTNVKGSTLTLGSTPAAPGAPAPGGANQKVAVEGCIGDTLFNGIWRMTVKKVEPIGPDVGLGPGWGVSVELRNGTQTPTNLQDTGLISTDLVMPDGNTFVFEERTAEEPYVYKKVGQAGGIIYTLRFHVQDSRALAASVPRPTKLVIQLDPKRLTAGYLKTGTVAYTTPNPSFRVRLDCTR